MKRIGHRIFLLLSPARVKSFVKATGCLFVQQENESRVFCLSPVGRIVSIGAADEELRLFKLCAKTWPARDRLDIGTTIIIAPMSCIIQTDDNYWLT